MAEEKDIIEFLGEDGIDEISGPGTKESTERHIMKLEIRITKLKRKFVEVQQQIQSLDEEYKKNREPLVEEQNRINTQVNKIDGDIFSILNPKIEDVEGRKRKKEREEGPEVG